MPVKTNREYRRTQAMEARADDSMIVQGYATTFDQPYELFRDADYIFCEQVDAHAFDDADMEDVIMQYDHEGRVFARISNGTLKLEADDHGLRIEAQLGGTEIGRQLFEEIKGGYTNRMSFGFTVAEETRSETIDHDTGVTTILRTITKIRKLYDVSAVSLPANDATEISARSLGEGVIAQAREECSAKQERMRKIEALKMLLEV